MNPPTGLTITAFYSIGDWAGYCHIKWTSPTQPADAYYRIEYHDVASSTWIWQTDVPPDQDTYGVRVQFVTAPSGGTPKTITVDQVRITAKDVAGISPDAAVTINTPTSITANHVAANNFAFVCSGKVGDTSGLIDFTWNDLTLFLRNGTLTLSKYGVTSPGVMQVLYSVTYNAVPSDLGPNRARIPISLIPLGITLDSDLTWDPLNPPSIDPDAPLWVVEGDLLTLTLTTSADDDPNNITAEFTFEYHREADLNPSIDPAISEIFYAGQLTIIDDPFFPFPADATVAYISGLPTGASFDPATMIVSGLFTGGDQTLELVFDITSQGNKTNREFVALKIAGVSDFNHILLDTVPVGIGPIGIALTPDDAFLYVANQSLRSNKISVIDTSTNTVTATILSMYGVYGLAVSPDGTKLYATYQINKLAIIDTSTNLVTSTITVGVQPYGVAVSPDGTRVYTANQVVAGGTTNGTISVIDTSSNTVIATITVQLHPVQIAVSPDNALVYVTNQGSNSLSVIDASTNAVIHTVFMGAGSQPYGVAVNLDGSIVYVANEGSYNVKMVETTTFTVTGMMQYKGSVPVPIGVVVRPDGQRVYATNRNRGDVSEFDPSTNREIRRITAGNNPVGIVVSSLASGSNRMYVGNQLGNNVSVFDVSAIPTAAVTPTINSGSSFSVNMDEVSAYVITTDIQADHFRASGLPTGLILVDRVITGETSSVPGPDTPRPVSLGPRPTVQPGDYIVQLQARNEWGWGDEFDLTITVTVPIPVISSSLTAASIIGEPFFYQIVASGNPFFYGADGLPDGLSIDVYTGVISGTPTNLSATSVVLNAINGGGAGTATLALALTLPPIPVIDTTTLMGNAITVDINEPFTFQPSASNNPTRWTADPLPQGLSFNTLNGTLSGQFQSNGFYDITFVAYNAGGASLPVIFHFAVGVTATGNGTTPPPPTTQLPIDIVDLWVDLDSSAVGIDGPGASTAAATVKRGDSTVITVIFHRAGVPVTVPLAKLYFGAKVAFDDDYIVYSDVSTRIDDGKYRTYPDFSDQNNDLDSILVTAQTALIGEIQWDLTDGTRRSTQTFDVTVLRDLLHPDPAP